MFIFEYMYKFPIHYEQPLFRPPSEAESLILQVTFGCSWNTCAFCEMYTSKSFRIKPFKDFKKEIEQIANSGYAFKKVFLADGDAMLLSTNKLLQILNEIKNQFPKVRRISLYARPSNFADKSINELKELKSAGLDLAYVGIESGDDTVLKNINKGETYQSTHDGLLKAKAAGIKLSVMILNGLDGKELSNEHAIHSANLVNDIQPDYLSTLVLSFPYREQHFTKRYSGKFTMLNKFELIEEMRLFLEHIKLKQTIFRSDHASNYLILKGILSKDKDLLINRIDNVLNHPKFANLRRKDERGL